MSGTSLTFENGRAEAATPAPEVAFARRMSRITVSAIREILKVTEQPEITSFAGGMPAPEMFPVEALAEAHADVFANEGPAAMQYSTTEGWLPLREWIASRMNRFGANTEASRVLITSGSQQGIDLVGKIFLEAGDKVMVENPCYLAALQVFGGYEASFIPVESDAEGMRIDQAARALESSKAKLIYVVTDFHNPKGTSLSLERRRQLLELSSKHRVPILEDNPYGELRYSGERIPSLAALDREGLVIHISTFSKTLCPGMRIGWLTASPQIMRAVVIAKQATDLHTSTIEQRAAAKLLETFDFDGHLARLCDVYGKRCRAMQAALEKHFPPGTSWTNPEGGLFLWVELPEHIAAEDLFEEALQDKVAFVTGASFFASRPRHNFMRLNFSNQTPEMIEDGVARIAAVLKRRMNTAK